MTSGAVTPDETAFVELAQDRRVIPVTRRVLADCETPIGVYRKLAGGPGTFLLESAEQAGAWSRYSFVGVRSRACLTERDGRAVWLGEPPDGVPLDGPPDVALRETVAALASARVEGLPTLSGGMVGFLGYDLVRRFERLP
ncbi:MAG: anthranilate synthase component I, partial [Micromonosporaceae bacterium]